MPFTEKNGSTTTVFIADDHLLVRVGIRTLLERLPRFTVIGEAKNGHEAFDLILAQQPALVLMDISMPQASGIEVASRLRAAGSASRIIMLSANEDRDSVMASLQAGSYGYLVKDLLLSELEIALDAVQRGEHYLSPRVAHFLTELATQGTAPTTTAQDVLTPRQKDVLAAVARGLSTKEIARELAISPKTVEFHRGQISERLDVHDIAAMVKAAIRLGLKTD